MAVRASKAVSAFLLCVLAIISHITPAHAETRVALVMGNSAYAHTAQLRNPANDAQLLSRTLASVGFKVTTVLNGTRDQMMRAMLEFGRLLRGANTTGLFYFAGHGFQVNGLNYLLPVDADIRDEDEVRLQAVSASEFLQTLDGGSSTAGRINIVILDACRNNPFSRGWRSAGRGLAPIEAPTGSFVGFSTAPGEVAYDGNGGNSPYAQGLSNAIRKPGLSIEQVFKSVRAFVVNATEKAGRPQVPWESTSLTGEFYFVPRAAEAEAQTARTMTSVMQEIHRDTRSEQVSASPRGPSWVKFRWIRATSIPADEECEVNLAKINSGAYQHEQGTHFGDACAFTFEDRLKGNKEIYLWGEAVNECTPMFYIRDRSHLTCISIQSRIEFLVQQARSDFKVDSSLIKTAKSEIAQRLQRTLGNYHCFSEAAEGTWNLASEQALARFARENAIELENLEPTIANLMRVEGGVSTGCAVEGASMKKTATQTPGGCAPRQGAQIFSEPNHNRPHPDWVGGEVGLSWSLMENTVVANATGRYLYGKLYSPRGGYQKWVYSLAEQWECH